MGIGGERMGRNVQSIKYSALCPAGKKAYNAYTNQLSKCNNPKNPDYKYYGAIGINVEYSRKEFIDWYMKESPNYAGTDPTIGRIDHSKSYSFDNITLQSFIENRSERWYRRGAIGHKPRKVGLFTKSGECFAVFTSIKECADYFAMDASGLHRTVTRGNPRGGKFSWRFKLV